MLFLYKALKITGKLSSTGKTANIAYFKDAKDVSGYAAEGVAAIVKEGIAGGSSEKKLNPKDYATRAETAVMLYAVVKK